MNYKVVSPKSKMTIKTNGVRVSFVNGQVVAAFHEGVSIEKLAKFFPKVFIPVSDPITTPKVEEPVVVIPEAIVGYREVVEPPVIPDAFIGHLEEVISKEEVIEEVVAPKKKKRASKKKKAE